MRTAPSSINARWLAAAAALGLLAGSARTYAEEGPGAGDSLEEITVTASKREESLQKVPVSVTVLTSAQLADVKMDTPSDLVTQVPNLQVNGIVGEGSPLFSLRGVSMFDYSLNQSSPVANYIDEVYKGNFTLFGVEMFDLERVEVLRGPQGTLYGKNTTGGAINFITKKPGFDDEADVTVGYGNYNRLEAEGDMQLVLIPDRLSMRLAATYTWVDGWVYNMLPNHPNLEGTDQYGARLSVLFKATDNLSFIMRASHSFQDPYNYAIIDGRIAPPLSAAGPNPSLCSQGGGGVGCIGLYWRTVSGAYGGTPLSNYQVAQDYTPRRQQSNDAVEITSEWQFSPDNKLTSITSWDDGHLFNPEGTDGAPYGIWSIPYYGSDIQWTQDLRVTSTGSAKFAYIAGAYYQHEAIFNSTENAIYTDPSFLTSNPNYLDCAGSSFAPAPGSTGYANGVVINPYCNYFNSFDQIRNSWAVYTDDSYQLTEVVKLRAGLRYNHDNGIQKNALDQLRGADQVPIANLGFFYPLGNGQQGPIEALPGSPGYQANVTQMRSQALHNVATTGRAGVDFQLSPDLLVYTDYSRGYRSGAFNSQFLFTPSDFTTVLPETLDAGEVGAKSAWLDRKLQIDGAMFFYQYKNQQIINVYPTGQQPLINLGRSRIYGAELSVVTRPIRTLTLRADMGYLRSQIEEGVLATGSVVGQQLPYAPHFSGTVAMDWEAWRVNDIKVNVHLDQNYNSMQYLALPNENAISQGGYGLLNGRVSFGNDRWDAGVWARNIFDRFYLTNAVDVQGFGFDYRHIGTPRMYGFNAHYHF